ncbi:MAG: tetratricopeptide repeat protein [bacterium]
METVEALEWLYYKGKKEIEKSEYESARLRFQKILNMTREKKWIERANAMLARIYLEEDNYFWAMDHIHRALDINPYYGPYLYIKAKIHMARQEWEKAAGEALKAVEENLENGGYYRLLGNASYHCAGYKTARRFLDWALECEPENIEIMLDLARLEVSEANFQAALNILKQALELTNRDESEKIRKRIRIIQENWKITGS